MLKLPFCGQLNRLLALNVVSYIQKAPVFLFVQWKWSTAYLMDHQWGLNSSLKYKKDSVIKA